MRASLGAVLVALLAASSAADERFGIGRPATSEDQSKLSAVVFPDGTGLPPGQGTVEEGRVVYARECASCHGAKGEGTEAFRRPLVGGIGTVGSDDPVLTVGSYWPYAPTLWDYTRRAMPWQEPGKLRAQDAYAVTALILYWNEIVDARFTASARTLPEVRMPNRDNFIPDARPDIPVPPAPDGDAK